MADTANERPCALGTGRYANLNSALVGYSCWGGKLGASSTFGTGLHGYRVTVLGHNKRVEVYAVCPENDWVAMQPVFDRVIASLVRGEPE